MPESQHTIASAITFEGKGLYTGKFAHMTLQPAEADTGIVFRRVDLEARPEVRALAELVSSTQRSTILSENEASVTTVEHLLSALMASGVDNALIDIDGPEVPILDGTAWPFFEALQAAGRSEQDAARKLFAPREKVVFEDEQTGSRIEIYPDDHFSVDVLIGFDSPILRNQFARLESLDHYGAQVAPARTFVFLREIMPLLQNGLVRGGSLDNAIVLVDQELSDETREMLRETFQLEHVKVNEQDHTLNNTSFKFDNEPARHKILDVIGDLALIGMPIRGKVIATKPGHSANVRMAQHLRKQIKKNRGRIEAPEISLSAKPLFDVVEIMRFLPHRPPFLLVDKIMEMSERHVVGIKNVTMNESFFQGHFPGAPVMPGVLIIEAMAQTAGMLVLNTVPDPENYLTYFMKIDKVKFRNQVKPGDTLVFLLDLITPIRRGIAHMNGYAFVAGQLVTEGEFMAQITKTK